VTLPFDVAVSATGARVIAPQRAPSGVRVVTDTRALQPGDTFLALRGERFDGHDFVGRAVAAGASALIVDDERACGTGLTTLLVGETLAAYLALASAARDRLRARVVGVTGSTGKTTTKFFLAQLLERRVRVAVSPANENNEIGVAKLLLSAGDEDVVVAEMGARKYADVAVLVAVARPHIGILTNVGEAHVEIMGSRERLAETKWGLFSLGAQAILNLSDEVSRTRAATLSQPPHWFYAGDDEPPVPNGSLCALVGARRLVSVAASGARDARDVDVRVAGRHNHANVAAAAAAALQLGIPLDDVAEAIPSLRLPAGRFERIELRSMQLIYDAYNASATGTIAALDTLAEQPARQRIAVLGGMAELGEESAVLHERVGARAAAVVDWLLAGGDYAEWTVRGAERAGLNRQRIVTYATNHEAAEWLREHARHDDLVLLKGSRKYQLEEIVEELRRT
jgi:UDP-N-acetylmuramoyl-tripeptide--D-alanyl-D-alanine ligase